MSIFKEKRVVYQCERCGCSYSDVESPGIHLCGDCGSDVINWVKINLTDFIERIFFDLIDDLGSSKHTEGDEE